MRNFIFSSVSVDEHAVLGMSWTETPQGSQSLRFVELKFYNLRAWLFCAEAQI